jgi:uncharacterized protein (TIGR02444 family)
LSGGTGAGDDFWRFSLALYGRPGVAPACLLLQDEHGRDENLVLYACWIGASGRGRLAPAGLAAAEAIAAPWRRAVIEPLRAARRAAKGAPDADDLYASLKAAELEAERIAQERLAAAAPTVQDAVPAAERVAAAAANLTLYLQPPAAVAAAAPLGPAVAALVESGY